MSKKVTILCGGQRHITSRKNAERYQRHGRARQVSENVFEFIEDDARHVAAVDSRKKRLCFDDGLASIESVKHLPCAGDAVRLFMGKRPAVQPREDRVIVLGGRRADASFDRSVVPSWPEQRPVCWLPGASA